MRSIKILLLLILLSAGTSHAKLSGIDWLPVTIEGVEYELPLYNADARKEFELVYRAVNGDEMARAVLLGTNNEKFIYMGDGDRHLWLYIDWDGQRVEEVK